MSKYDKIDLKNTKLALIEELNIDFLNRGEYFCATAIQDKLNEVIKVVNRINKK